VAGLHLGVLTKLPAARRAAPVRVWRSSGMWIVEKNGRPVRKLAAFERDLVFGHVAGTLKPDEVPMAARLLRAVRAEGRWFACECETPHPLLNVQLRGNGRLVLRNNHTSPAHHVDCGLIKQERSTSQPRERVGGEVVRPDDTQVLKLLPEFAPAGATPPTRSGAPAQPRASKVKEERLLSLLLALCEKAGLDRYDPSAEMDVLHQYGLLREAVASFEIAPGVSADKFARFKLDKSAVIDLAVRLKKADVFGDRRRYGLLVCRPKSWGVHHLVVEKDEREETHRFFGRLQAWGEPSGPCLALSTIATPGPDSRFYELADVAVVPVLSNGHLMPIAGSTDRDAMGEVVKIIRWLHRSKKRTVVMRRHLFGGGSLELADDRTFLSVDISDAAEAADDGEGLEQEGHLSLRALGGDIDLLKRRIARAFLKENP